MYNTKCFLLCFLSCYVLQSSADYVTFVKLCPKGDNACVKSTAQATIPYVVDGVPELGLQPADPLHIDEINYDDANLKMKFTNNEIAGPRNTKILEAELDIDQGTMKLKIDTPLNITGQYVLRGKVLFLEALGDGDYSIQTDRTEISLTANIKTIEKDGHKFWKPTKVDYTYNLVEKVHLQFKNLFGGDNAAAEPLQKLIDEQWKELINTFGKPILDKMVSEYLKVIENFLMKLPVEEVAN